MRFLYLFLTFISLIGCLKTNNKSEESKNNRSKNGSYRPETGINRRVLNFNRMKVLNLSPLLKKYPDALGYSIFSKRGSVYITKDEAEYNPLVKVNATSAKESYSVKVQLPNEVVVTKLKF